MEIYRYQIGLAKKCEWRNILGTQFKVAHIVFRWVLQKFNKLVYVVLI